MADTSQYGYSLDYRRMTIGPGLIFNLLLQAHRSTLRRLDFTTGKQVDRGELPKTSKAVALANELERLKESTWDLLSHNTRVVAK